MFNIQVDAKDSDLFIAYQSTKNHLKQVAPDNTRRNAIAAMLVIAAARDVCNKDPDMHGTFTISGLIKNVDIKVNVDAERIAIEPYPEDKQEPAKSKRKTSVPPKKPRVYKQQDKKDPKTQRTKVGDNLYCDGNGYYFNGQGQAVGKNGKPTADPYNINIDPMLPTGPTVPVVPNGSAGIHGSYEGGDF